MWFPFDIPLLIIYVWVVHSGCSTKQWEKGAPHAFNPLLKTLEKKSWLLASLRQSKNLSILTNAHPVIWSTALQATISVQQSGTICDETTIHLPLPATRRTSSTEVGTGYHGSANPTITPRYQAQAQAWRGHQFLLPRWEVPEWTEEFNVVGQKELWYSTTLDHKINILVVTPIYNPIKWLSVSTPW